MKHSYTASVTFCYTPGASVEHSLWKTVQKTSAMGGSHQRAFRKGEQRIWEE